MAALGEYHEGEPISAQFPDPTVAYIIEGMYRKYGIICIELTPYIGQVQVEDASKPGEVTKLVAGDVLHIEQGSRNTFTSLGGISRKISFCLLADVNLRLSQAS